MKPKPILLFVFSLIYSNLLICQTDKTQALTPSFFCGKKSIGDQELNAYSREELKQCDLKLTADNNELKIIKFKLTIFSKNKNNSINEFEIKGDRIPDQFRKDILNPDFSHLFLEFIKAVNIKGEEVTLNPVKVRVN